MASAYRAVHLRVHPTGKCVLSLSCDGGGKEDALAQVVGDELGIPDGDVKVVQHDVDRFGYGHGYLTDSSPGLESAVRKTCGKIKEKARYLAAGMVGTSPDSLQWSGDNFGGERIPEIALYAHGGAIELPAGPDGVQLEGSLDAQTTFRE